MFQTFIDPGDYDSFCGDVERILRLSYLAECPFLFTPGQIALASLELACTHESTQWAHKYESVFSAYREHWLPRWNKSVKPIGWDLKKRPMRQEIDEVFVENGAFYITSRSNLIHSGLRYSGKTGIFEMPFSSR